MFVKVDDVEVNTGNCPARGKGGLGAYLLAPSVFLQFAFCLRCQRRKILKENKIMSHMDNLAYATLCHTGLGVGVGGLEGNVCPGYLEIQGCPAPQEWRSVNVSGLLLLFNCVNMAS